MLIGWLLRKIQLWSVLFSSCHLMIDSNTDTGTDLVQAVWHEDWDTEQEDTQPQQENAPHSLGLRPAGRKLMKTRWGGLYFINLKVSDFIGNTTARNLKIKIYTIRIRTTATCRGTWGRGCRCWRGWWRWWGTGQRSTTGTRTARRRWERSRPPWRGRRTGGRAGQTSRKYLLYKSTKKLDNELSIYFYEKIEKTKKFKMVFDKQMWLFPVKFV